MGSVANTSPFNVNHTLLGLFVALMSLALASSTLAGYRPHEEAYVAFCRGFN
jgi:hypothetical protein